MIIFFFYLSPFFPPPSPSLFAFLASLWCSLPRLASQVMDSNLATVSIRVDPSLAAAAEMRAAAQAAREAAEKQAAEEEAGAVSLPGMERFEAKRSSVTKKRSSAVTVRASLGAFVSFVEEGDENEEQSDEDEKVRLARLMLHYYDFFSAERKRVTPSL